MINAVGRDIPQEILDITGKEVFQGNLAKDGTIFKKHGPMVKAVLNNNGSKLVPSIAEVLKLCNSTTTSVKATRSSTWSWTPSTRWA